MKLYSWNMYFRNPEQNLAFEFIASADFDIFCLQEVPEDFLQRLKALPYQISYGVDVDRGPDFDSIRNYCVILSKHPLLESESFPFPDLQQPLRTRLLIRLMRPFGWLPLTNRRSLWADALLPEIGRTRIFCLHLTLAYPEMRWSEFDTAIALKDDDIPLIVCGDLNILESARVTLLNYLMGGSFMEIFAWKSERRAIEKRFAAAKLQNPLRAKRTQTISHSQLDHILVPDTFEVVEAKVLQDRIGSDHHPIFIEARVTT